MKRKFLSVLTIICFVSIILIPIGICFMWFSTQWKKRIKILLTSVLSALYIALIVIFLLLEPSYNTSGVTLPLSYNKGYTAFESNNASTKKPAEKKSTDLKSSTSTLDDIIDNPKAASKLPRKITKAKGGKNSRFVYLLAVILLMLYLIIRRNLKSSKKADYENPYVDTNLYKLPLADDAKMPMVHFLHLQPNAGEKILFATETNQQGNEGSFVVTNQRVIILNKEENSEFPLKVLEAVSSVSNNVMLLTSGSRKYYIFMHESQLKYALAVVRWAYKKIETN